MPKGFKGFQKGHKPFYGMTGKHHSEETKQKLRIIHALQIPPMKGKSHSEESKKKMRDSHKGRKLTEEHKKKISDGVKIAYKNGKIKHYLLGKSFSEEHKRKISIANKGKKKPPFTEEHKRKISKFQKNRKRGPRSIETRKKMAEARKGEKSSSWKGGITPINNTIRKSLEYKLWREAVFKRDNFTCRFCGIRGGILQADHIKRFADYPELRFAIDNGRTLCIPCHLKTDTYGNKSNLIKD